MILCTLFEANIDVFWQLHSWLFCTMDLLDHLLKVNNIFTNFFFRKKEKTLIHFKILNYKFFFEKTSKLIRNQLNIELYINLMMKIGQCERAVEKVRNNMVKFSQPNISWDFQLYIEVKALQISKQSCCAMPYSVTCTHMAYKCNLIIYFYYIF